MLLAFLPVARTVKRMRRWIIFAVLVSTADAVTTWVALRNGAVEGNPGAQWLFDLVGFYQACVIAAILWVFLGMLCGWKPKRSAFRLLPVAGRAVLWVNVGVIVSNLLVILHLLAK